MTHEIKLLFETLNAWNRLGKKAVFVSVVSLEGSSYRRPGVRMVISNDGDSVGAASLISPAFENIDTSVIDEQTAVVLMTHSFHKDVQYLMALKDIKPAYLGIIGSVNRRERLLSALLDYYPDISPEFLDQIHGPAGINIGAESASEIAVSVLAEILSVIRHYKPVALREKAGSIHG